MACFRSVTQMFVLVMLATQVSACAPGRSGYRRRAPRRLTPLVIKQYVPNTAEQNEIAAGEATGVISRTSKSFRKLVPNYNGDIRFLDDEGTGADRIMTQRRICHRRSPRRLSGSGGRTRDLANPKSAISADINIAIIVLYR
ncbi:sonic hedgehog protein-like [Tropilaelaps mercedesae]|uniref:Sonic hedgehog protein-like n=1 Tax=Tropilaelaps mercedesae TaxID=418985 RepID=A0A1V9X435_9ACAR|nr:sonic hedgehog protein-like [Tropilaelaps mercedesae]